MISSCFVGCQEFMKAITRVAFMLAAMTTAGRVSFYSIVFAKVVIIFGKVRH